LVFGGSSEEAVRRCIALEEAAEVALLAAAIGGAVALLPAQAMAAADAREV
jgi:ribulose-5-phosphate 4-epimerase/fuculose-1-phosphate aldolase